MQYRSNQVGDTNRIAIQLTEQLTIRLIGKTGATVIALEGELGAGKTTFVKALAKALGVKVAVTSPTFVLMKSYPLQHPIFKKLVHLDAYRLNDYRALWPLEIKTILADPANLVLIEWAERVKPILPRKFIKVQIDHTGENTRKLTISK